MKSLSISICLLLLATFVNAQDLDDVLRYSQSDIIGTAKYSSMGGALGALGGDISAISDNPAGLGLFMYQELNFTNDFRYINSSTEYLNTITDDNKINFGFNNFGYVGSTRVYDTESPIKAINFAITYRKMDNYSQRIYTEAYNNKYSITDHFADMAYGTRLSELDDGTGGSDMVYNAYNTYLIDPLTTNGDNIDYVSALNGFGSDQIHAINKKGRRCEFATSIGLNLEDKLYFGAMLNFNTIKYVYSSQYQEIDNKQEINNFNYLEYDNKFTAEGITMQLKLGAIYKALPWLRLGVAFHTPSLYAMEETYDENSMTSQMVDVNANKENTYTSTINEGKYEYHLITPLKTSASVGFVIKKSAMIGIEYEFTPYQMAFLKTTQGKNVFSEENKFIEDVTQPGHNLKVGAEYRFSILSFRLGCAYLGSPYKSSRLNKDAYTLYYSGGLGVNWNKFYMDFAYSLAENQQYYFPYQLQNVSPYNIQTSKSNYMVTLGFRF